MRALLDTNIIYDIMCKRPYDEQGLLELKVMHAFGDVELWACAKSYTDLFCLASREIGSTRAQDLLERTLSWVRLCSIDGEDVEAALGAHWEDFEDCLVDICASKVKADYLVTRDRDGFSRSSIPHGTASEFMAYVFEKTQVRYSLEDVAGV